MLALRSYKKGNQLFTKIKICSTSNGDQRPSIRKLFRDYVESYMVKVTVVAVVTALWLTMTPTSLKRIKLVSVSTYVPMDERTLQH